MPPIGEGWLRFFLLSGHRVTPSESELERPYRARHFFAHRTQGVALGWIAKPRWGLDRMDSSIMTPERISGKSPFGVVDSKSMTPGACPIP